MSRAPELVLSCNAAGCLILPAWTPRLYVPAKAVGLAPEANHQYPAIRLMLIDIHFCEFHWEKYASVDSILRDAVKARIEQRGKQIWPEGVRPDFDAAHIYKVGIYTPEFARFIGRLGYQTDGLGFSRAMVQRRRA